MDSKRNIGLGDMLFIPFYNALINDDYKSLGLTQNEFWELTDEFLELSNNKINQLDKQLSKVLDKIAILKASLLILTNKYDKEFADIVKNLDVVFEEKEQETGLKNIIAKIEKLTKYYKILETQKPPEPKNLEETNGYDIVANMGVSLEFSLNFETLTINQYFSYSKAIKRKNDSLKNIQK